MKQESPHVWQQFTEICVVCGFSAYDKDIPDSCPGDSKIYAAREERRRRREQKRRDEEYGDDW